MGLGLLAVGDIAWDIFIRPQGEFVRGSDVLGTVDVMPGGAAANVAVWAHRLGAEVALVGKVGDDTLGTLMLAHLRSEGVARQVITVSGGLSTRVGILVSADGAPAEILRDASAGIATPASDAPALAASFRTLIEDPAAGRAMGERGRAFAAGSDRRLLVQRFEEVLRVAIERHKR